MSWNKNTISMSEIDSTMGVLKDLNVDFRCEEIRKVRGYGLNDYLMNEFGKTQYSLRRLTYDNFVILEQIIRDSDCDIDDIIVSSKFTRDKEPDDWKIEIKENDKNYDDNFLIYNK